MNLRSAVRQSLLIPTLVGAVVFGMPDSAEAVECIEGIYEWTPVSGSTDVPLNASLWLESMDYMPESGEFSGEAYLTVGDRDGEPVAIDVRWIGAGLIVVTPKVNLTANTEYVFFAPDGADYSDLEFEFATGDKVDVSTPALPSFQLDDTWNNLGDWDDWGGSAGFELTVEGLEPGGIVLFDINDSSAWNGDFRASTVTGAVTGVSDYLNVSSGSCSNDWPGAPSAAGKKTEVRLGVVDVAGNFSGWSDVIEFELPDMQDFESTSVDSGDIVPDIEPSVSSSYVQVDETESSSWEVTDDSDDSDDSVGDLVDSNTSSRDTDDVPESEDEGEQAKKSCSVVGGQAGGLIPAALLFGLPFIGRLRRRSSRDC